MGLNVSAIFLQFWLILFFESWVHFNNAFRCTEHDQAPGARFPAHTNIFEGPDSFSINHQPGSDHSDDLGKTKIFIIEMVVLRRPMFHQAITSFMFDRDKGWHLSD
jgi:hypothetical protein